MKFFFSFLFQNVLFQFLCNIQQYYNSNYNSKLNNLAEMIIINQLNWGQKRVCFLKEKGERKNNN